MKESFLHHIWQMQYFDKGSLHTSEREPIQIFNPGTYNTDAGPDFSSARIRIGPMDWVGSVEIHTLSSEWINHHHDDDAAYQNVILHVVWKMDKPIYRHDKSLLPTLELRGLVSQALILTYRQLINSALSIPCQRSFSAVPDITRMSMIEKVMIARLERKTGEILSLLDKKGGNWEEIFYLLLCRNFGFKVNAEPFFQLGNSLPLRILQKHSGQLEIIEALLFGQAGFLEGKKGDTYYLSLRKEYLWLSKKYSLESGKLSKSQWRFLRLRPANFPTLRIAQLAGLLTHHRSLFSRVLEAHSKDELEDIFNFVPSVYWQHHYQFSRPVSGTHDIGKSSIESLLINLVVPFWAAYAKRFSQDEFMDKALNLLQGIPPEKNKITVKWSVLGMNPDCAYQSQALIELFNSFCQKKNCLHCNIGASLVRPIQ